MVQHGSVAGTILDGFNEDVFPERQLDPHGKRRDIAARRDLEFEWQLEHPIRGPGHRAVPPLLECRSTRRGPFTFGRSGIDPRHERVDVALTQPAVVAEIAVLRIGIPGRHFARQHLFLNRAAPWFGLGVVQQRHGRHLAGTMAGDAV